MVGSANSSGWCVTDQLNSFCSFVGAAESHIGPFAGAACCGTGQSVESGKSIVVIVISEYSTIGYCSQARFIERLKRRGREYVDVQRKSNALLVTTSALCTATSASTTHNKTKRSTKGPSSTSTMAGEDRDSHSDYAGYSEDAPHSATSHRRERGAEGEQPLAPHMYPASALKQGSSYGGDVYSSQGAWR
jgi:hypothetical protein